MNDDDAHLVETQLASEVGFKGRLLEVRSDKVKLPERRHGHARVRRASGRRARRPRAGRRPARARASVPLSRAPRDARIPGRQARCRRGDARVREARARGGSGYAAATWKKLGTIHPVIGYSTEFIEMYEATGLTHVGQRAGRRRVPRRRPDERERAPRDLRLRRLHGRQVHRGAVRVAALQRQMSPCARGNGR